MRVTIQTDELIPEGMYPAIFTAAEPFDQGPYGPAVRLEFTLQGPDYQGQTVNGIASIAKVSPNSKLYRWIKVLAGTDFDPGVEVDLQGYIGRSVGVLMKHSVSSKGGQSATYSNVSDLVPLNSSWFSGTPSPKPAVAQGGESRPTYTQPSDKPAQPQTGSPKTIPGASGRVEKPAATPAPTRTVLDF